MKGKIIAFVIALVVIALFNVTNRPIRTQEQKAFDLWLESVEPAFGTHDPSAMTQKPIIIQIRSESSQRKFSWELSTTEGKERADQVLRLLRLAKEGDVFSRSDNKEGVIDLKVTQGDKSFSTILSENFISSNPQAGNLVKLFELYAESKNLGAIGGSV